MGAVCLETPRGREGKLETPALRVCHDPLFSCELDEVLGVGLSIVVYQRGNEKERPSDKSTAFMSDHPTFKPHLKSRARHSHVIHIVGSAALSTVESYRLIEPPSLKGGVIMSLFPSQ